MGEQISTRYGHIVYFCGGLLEIGEQLEIGTKSALVL